METKLTRLLNWLSLSCLYLIVFLVPLFFLPITLNGYELNKNYLFFGLTLLSFLAYLGRGVILKNFSIRRTVLDRLLIVLWLLYLVSSIFSLDRYLSFFGDFNLLNFSFVGFSISLVFFFLAVQHIKSSAQILKIIYVLLASGFFSALYFLIKIFSQTEIFNWPLPAYNLVSGSNMAFGVFLVFILLLSWGILIIRKHNFFLDLFVFLVWLVTLVAIVIIGFNILWVILIFSLAIMLAFFFTHLNQARTTITSLGLVILVAGILFVLLGEPKFLVAQLPGEVSLGAGTSWSLMSSTLTHSFKNALLGSGPATFAYDFAKFRPQEINMSFAWDTNFNQSYSSAFELISTHGILFSLVFLALILIVLGVMFGTWLRQITELKKRGVFTDEVVEKTLVDSSLLFWVLSGVWLSTFISLFLINFGMTHWLVFWLITVLVLESGSIFSKFAIKEKSFSLKTAPQYAFLTSFLSILFFTAIIVIVVYLGRFYIGEVYYFKSISQNFDEKNISLQKAISFNPERVQFYLSSAEAFLGKATEINSTTKDSAQISQFLALSINAAKAATDHAPNNATSWWFLSSIYSNARSIVPEANSWVISSLQKAIELEPTNPIMYVSLGNANLLDKNYTETKDNFEKAIALKPDFLIAYINLANLFETQNKIDDSIAALEKGLSYGSQNAEYLFQLGRYYFNRKGKDDNALAELAFTKAIQLNSNYSDALYALALLYERNGFTSAALPLYKKVLELNPTNKDVENKIDLLSGSPISPAPEKVLPKTSSKK